VKDFDLPISILSSPYFEYFLELYEKDFQTQTKYQYLLDALSSLKGESGLAKESARIKDSIIKDIKGTAAFERFSEVPESKFKHHDVSNHSWTSADVFKQPNTNKIFIAIDLTSANFNSLRKVIGDDIVLGAHSWNDLISRYSTLPYFKYSKAFRQLIFGNLNPNKQKVLITFICRTLLDLLVETPLKNRITNVLADEIEIESSLEGANSDLEIISRTLMNSEYFDILHIEVYRLALIPPRSYFVKEIFKLTEFVVDTKSIVKRSFKCIPSIYFA
jgi:hypothetical protein